MPRSARQKPLEWARAARDAFDASIDFIASEDPFTARLVVERVETALTQIQAHPKIGRPAGARGRRTFSIPNSKTGSVSLLSVQILSLTMFERIPLDQLLNDIIADDIQRLAANQLNLFD